jgi:uncharacterized DUF497 family protein
MNDSEIKWDPAKDEWLKLHRNLSFEMVEKAFDAGHVVDDYQHPTRVNQRILVIRVEDYICAVPYVVDGKVMFLKTMYRSRKLNSEFGGFDGKES